MKWSCAVKPIGPHPTSEYATHPAGRRSFHRGDGLISGLFQDFFDIWRHKQDSPVADKY